MTRTVKGRKPSPASHLTAVHTEHEAPAEGANSPIRILVVHHQPILRSALTSLLQTADSFLVVGEAGNCAECCEKMGALRPDVLVCHLPANQSCKTAHVNCLSAVNPETPVVVFTGHEAHLQILKLAQLGFKGLLTSEAPRNALFEAVRAVTDGRYFLDQRAQSILMDAMDVSSKRKKSTISDFSEREHQVLEFLAQGKTNDQIAAALHVSTSTVKHCVSSVLLKLGAANRAAAVRAAVAKGLLMD